MQLIDLFTTTLMLYLNTLDIFFGCIGDYEFIDVVIKRTKFINEHFFLYINFMEELEIPRPTDKYNASLQQLLTLWDHEGYVQRTQKIVEVQRNVHSTMEEVSLHVVQLGGSL